MRRWDSSGCFRWGILQIPQAGLAATDEKLKTNRGEVIEVVKAAIDGLDYTAIQKEDATALIGKWMSLTPAQAINSTTR